MITQRKYFQNLRTDTNFIYSYDTKVAQIDHANRLVIVSNWYSITTSKHVNYIAGLLNYDIKKNY
jgi:hypothetical protein